MQFIAGVAENRAEGGIAFFEAAGEVRQADTDGRMTEDRTHARFAGAQRSFGAAPSRHVMEYHYGAGEVSLEVPDRSGAILDRDFRPVARNQCGVIGEPDDGSCLQDFFNGILCLSARVLVDDIEDFSERTAVRI